MKYYAGVFLAGALLGVLSLWAWTLGAMEKQEERTKAFVAASAAQFAGDTARLNLRLRDARYASDTLARAADSLRIKASEQHARNRLLHTTILRLKDQRDTQPVPRPVVDTLLAAYDSVVSENRTLREVAQAQMQESVALRRALTVADSGLAVRDRRIAGLDSALRKSVSRPGKFLGLFPAPSRSAVFVVGAVAGFLISKRGGL